MKICSMCSNPKFKKEFHRNKTHADGLQTECKLCVRQHNQIWHINNRTKIRKIRKTRRSLIAGELMRFKQTLCCEICGESEPACLDFHHKNPKEKEFEIANALSVGRSLQNIFKEIQKCVCVCANCHRKIHCGLINI